MASIHDSADLRSISVVPSFFTLSSKCCGEMLAELGSDHTNCTLPEGAFWLYSTLILPKQQAYICEVLQTKRGSIPLGMSLLVCGPAWAWTRDLQIMRTTKWYSAMVSFLNIYCVSNNYEFSYLLWNSLNPPNWNRLFTHCLRRFEKNCCNYSRLYLFV